MRVLGLDVRFELRREREGGCGGGEEGGVEGVGLRSALSQEISLSVRGTMKGS